MYYTLLLIQSDYGKKTYSFIYIYIYIYIYIIQFWIWTCGIFDHHVWSFRPHSPWLQGVRPRRGEASTRVYCSHCLGFALGPPSWRPWRISAVTTWDLLSRLTSQLFREIIIQIASSSSSKSLLLLLPNRFFFFFFVSSSSSSLILLSTINHAAFPWTIRNC